MKQENRSVDEYQAEFTALSHFAPHLVSTEEQRALRFIKGLKNTIRNRVIPLNLKKFDLALHTTQMIERDMEEQKEEDQNPRAKGKATSSQLGPQRHEFKGKRTAFGGRRPMAPKCETCGGEHRGRPFYRKSGGCFKCGERVHQIRDCPKWGS